MSTSGTAGKGGTGGGNVYNQSANAYGASGNLLGNAAALYNSANPGAASTYNPAMANAAGYNPAMAQAHGYGAANAGSTGYKASLMNAASTRNPADISTGINQYMNPYNQQVVNASIRDVNKLVAQQNAQTGANAANVGAFGGSRQGVVEALTNSEAQQNIGSLAANLRQQGFETAAGLSAQDIANQMTTGQFNASLLQQARGQNQAALNQGAQFGAAAKNTASLANQAAQNAAREYGATAKNNMGLANQAARNDAREYGATAQNNMSLANQAARNTAGQFNANVMNQRDMDNVSTQLAKAAGMGGLAGQAQGLGSTLFNTGQTINADQMQAGGLQQQLLQQILGQASGQYDQFMGMPQNLLNMQLAALGMNPLTTATTTTGKNNPGLLDFLGLGTQALGAWRMGA